MIKAQSKREPLTSNDTPGHLAGYSILLSTVPHSVIEAARFSVFQLPEETPQN